MAFIVKAHVHGLNLQKLVGAADSLKRLAVLINQSLRCTAGTLPDEKALREAAELVNLLRT
jgi:hypothetical protein